MTYQELLDQGKVTCKYCGEKWGKLDCHIGVCIGYKIKKLKEDKEHLQRLVLPE
jgi:hypothetical protein|tara:strand:- start:145 stop:306 length:162 start_codon:yes stop_codon:yes gene_type:complete